MQEVETAEAEVVEVEAPKILEAVEMEAPEVLEAVEMEALEAKVVETLEVKVPPQEMKTG